MAVNAPRDPHGMAASAAAVASGPTVLFRPNYDALEDVVSC